MLDNEKGIKVNQSIWYREDVTPEEWEAFAVEQDKLSVESQQRQWQNWQDDVHDFYGGKIAALQSRRADLARNHGIDWVFGLVELEDQSKVVDADLVDGKFGAVWRIKNADGSVSWLNPSKAQDIVRKQKNYASKGYQLAAVYYHFADGRYGFYPIKERGVVKIEVQR